MWALLIVVPAPSLHLLPSIFKAHEPVGAEAFDAEAPVEGLDERIVGGLAGPGEVEHDTLRGGPSHR